MAQVGDETNIPKESSEKDKMVEVDDIDADLHLHHPESDAELVPGAPEMSDQDKIDHLEKISDYIAYGKSLMSIALLTANANQLRYAIELDSDYRIFLVILISLSILLQVLASILLFVSRYSYKSQQYSKAHRYNMAIGIMVMIIIFINVLALSFGAPDIAENIIHPHPPQYAPPPFQAGGGAGGQ